MCSPMTRLLGTSVAMRKRSTPAPTSTKASTSASKAAKARVPKEREGSIRLAAKPAAKCPTSMVDLAVVAPMSIPGDAGRAHSQAIRNNSAANRSIGGELRDPLACDSCGETDQLNSSEAAARALALQRFFEGDVHFPREVGAKVARIQSQQH